MIEAASVEDVDRIVELWVNLIEHGRGQGLSLRADENRTAAREVLAAAVADDRAFVARHDDRIVGFCTLRSDTGGFERDAARGVIENLYVEPAYRGDGLGSGLLEAGEQCLAELGAEEVTVEAAMADEGVQSFYADHGYVPRRVTLTKRVDDDASRNQ